MSVSRKVTTSAGAFSTRAEASRGGRARTSGMRVIAMLAWPRSQVAFCTHGAARRSHALVRVSRAAALELQSIQSHPQIRLRPSLLLYVEAVAAVRRHQCRRAP